MATSESTDHPAAAYRVRAMKPDSEREHRRAIDILLTAFADSVPMKELSDFSHSPELLREFFITLVGACLIGGSVTICTDEGAEKIDGVALWWGPGKVMFGSEEERAVLAPLLLKMSEEVRRWWKEEFLSDKGHVGTLAGEESKAGWYLAALAVHPDAQSKGVGSALVRQGLARAKEDKVPATVEYANPKNAEFYEKLGFKVRGITTTHGPHTTWNAWVCVRDVPA